jgi:hypothetical protein
VVDSASARGGSRWQAAAAAAAAEVGERAIEKPGDADDATVPGCHESLLTLPGFSFAQSSVSLGLTYSTSSVIVLKKSCSFPSIAASAFSSSPLVNGTSELQETLSLNEKKSYSLRPEYKHSYYSNSRNNGADKRHLYFSFYTIHQLSTHPPTPLFLSLSIGMLIL